MDKIEQLWANVKCLLTIIRKGWAIVSVANIVILGNCNCAIVANIGNYRQRRGGWEVPYQELLPSRTQRHWQEKRGVWLSSSYGNCGHFQSVVSDKMDLTGPITVLSCWRQQTAIWWDLSGPSCQIWWIGSPTSHTHNCYRQWSHCRLPCPPLSLHCQQHRILPGSSLWHECLSSSSSLIKDTMFCQRVVPGMNTFSSLINNTVFCQAVVSGMNSSDPPLLSSTTTCSLRCSVLQLSSWTMTHPLSRLKQIFLLWKYRQILDNIGQLWANVGWLLTIIRKKWAIVANVGQI